MSLLERRRYPRLAIALPIAHRLVGTLDEQLRHDLTINVSAGGVTFQSEATERAGDKLVLELSVPPGEGYSPYEGKIRGIGTVLRCLPAGERWRVAARFDQPLDLQFGGPQPTASS